LNHVKASIQVEKCYEQMFYTKLSRWKEEDEYRIVRPLTDCEYYKPDVMRTITTPMDMNTYLFEFSLDCVESVTFGTNMSYQNKNVLLKLAKARRHKGKNCCKRNWKIIVDVTLAVQRIDDNEKRCSGQTN
jgi:hypothetical protein